MKNKPAQFLLTALALLGITASVQAQGAGGSGNPYFFENLFSDSMVITAGLVILGALGALIYLLNVMVKVQQLKIYQEQGLEAYLEEVKKPQESFWRRMYKRWTNVVPIEKERDILMDHNYDGIRELDNSLPPWWVAMFYVSIAFAVVYMTYYHFAGVGMSSTEAYQEEMQEAEEAKKAFLARQSNLVDENNVVALKDESELSLGKTIFETNCLACHGAMGEGGVGPNLTDQYWIHGGDIKDLFRTIKYGVPEKGMIPWQSQLRPADMQRVASYILTMQGTNPPNAKAPEGTLYEGPNAENTETAADSTKTEVLGFNQ